MKRQRRFFLLLVSQNPRHTRNRAKYLSHLLYYFLFLKFDKIPVDKIKKVCYNYCCRSEDAFRTHSNRGVAQFGRVLGSGPRGRAFESRHSDHMKIIRTFFLLGEAFGLFVLSEYPDFNSRKRKQPPTRSATTFFRFFAFSLFSSYSSLHFANFFISSPFSKKYSNNKLRLRLNNCALYGHSVSE